MTALDVLTLLLVGGGLVLGAMRGFVAEMLALAAWVVGIAALKLLHTPLTGALEGTVGTWAGAAVLAFALIFGIVFIAGKLLAWNNLRADGRPNVNTLHHGMKVRAGTKYVVTKWFREKPWGW